MYLNNGPMSIFVLLKHKFYRKTVGVSRIQTWIAGVEGKHSDHLTTTRPKYTKYSIAVKVWVSDSIFFETSLTFETERYLKFQL